MLTFCAVILTVPSTFFRTRSSLSPPCVQRSFSVLMRSLIYDRFKAFLSVLKRHKRTLDPWNALVDGRGRITVSITVSITVDPRAPLDARSHISQCVCYVSCIIYAQHLSQTSLTFTQMHTHSLSLSSFSSFFSKCSLFENNR